jgi:hypothetical protein
VAPTCYSDISRVAHVAARSYANAVVKRELDEHLRRRHGTQPATTAMHLLSSRPSSVGSAAHARYLSLGMAYNASLLGEQRSSTPASIVGPGCHGALLAIAHSGRYPAVASAQLGLEATSRWPFADRPVAADREQWRGAQTYHRRFVPRACRLCRGRDSMEDIFHLACECPHPAMRAAQAAITAALPALVTAIWTRGLDAIEAGNAAPPTLSAEQQRALDQLRGGARIDGDSTREFPTLVYRCLLGNMYPSEAALADQHALAALGALFNALDVTARHLRPFAAAWLPWSERQICGLATAWRAACSSAAAGTP